MNDIHLEPCPLPWCGHTLSDLSIERVQSGYGEPDGYYVYCGCGLEGPEAPTPQEAADAWNRREKVQEPTLREEESFDIDACLKRSGYDISPCRDCGQPTICLPDGMGAWCEECHRKSEEGGNND
jgi:hypothetical protein